MENRPPKWADRFLQWYCNPDLLEEIQGDIYEIFERSSAVGHKRRAKIKFIWDVFRFFKWSNIKKIKTQNSPINNTAMISNYFKTGSRNLIKDKITSAISILGLGLAIGCTITTYFFIDYSYSIDSYHSKYDRIYQIINEVDNSGKTQLVGDVPIMISPVLQELSQIDEITRIEFHRANFKYQDKVFRELIEFTDVDYLKVFDYQLKQGSINTLEDPSQIIISQNMAIKYFGQDNPLGKQISIKFGNGESKSFVIGGVLDEFNARSTFNPEILISIDVFNSLYAEKYASWDYDTDAIFFILKEGADIASIDRQLASVVSMQNEANPSRIITATKAYSMKEVILLNQDIVGSIFGAGGAEGRVALIIVCILLLTLACVNYINIAVSSSSKRLKEIAMRKVMGGSRGMIVRQFIIENLLISFLAVLGGVLFSYFVFMPGFNSLIPVTIPFESANPLNMIYFLMTLLFVIGLLSGFYPALYISKFHPVSIFKGSQKFGRKSLLSKSLLTIQFIIAFLTIVAAFVFNDATMQLNKKDWGYSPDNLITVNVSSQANSNALYNEMISLTDVKEGTKSFGHLGAFDRFVSVKYGENSLQSFFYETEHNYPELLQVHLLEGRTFRSDADKQKVLVNKEVVKRFGWQNALEEHIYIDSIRYDVIGVIENVLVSNFFGEIDPVIIKHLDTKNANYFTFKTESGSDIAAMKVLESTWKKLYPEDPMNAMYQREVLENFYRENRSNVAVMSFIALLTLVIASVGLYGLVAYNITRRLKEFSVRKVLGASVNHILKLINREYMGLLALAFIIGAPLGVWTINQLLESIYPEVPSLTPWPLVLAFAAILGSFLLTIAYQLFKVAHNNPVTNLKEE